MWNWRRLYENFYEDGDKFGLSNYKRNSIFDGKTNKTAIDKIKVEIRDVAIVEFIGLKSKMCFFIK